MISPFSFPQPKDWVLFFNSVVGRSSLLCQAGLLPRIPSYKFYRFHCPGGHIKSPKNLFVGHFWDYQPHPGLFLESGTPRNFSKVWYFGQGDQKGDGDPSYGKVPKTGIYAPNFSPLSLFLYLFQLSIKNSANIYIKQINEWINIWVPLLPGFVLKTGLQRWTHNLVAGGGVGDGDSHRYPCVL